VLGGDDFIPNDGVGLASQVEVTPRVIADFVAVFFDRPCAHWILLCPAARDKERRLHLRGIERADQLIEAIGFCACIECQGDLVVSDRAATNLDLLAAVELRQREQRTNG
jgi:hypothetical protein